MSFRKNWIVGLGAMLLAGGAHANLIVSSIDVAIVKTTFNSKKLPGGLSPEEAFNVSYETGFLPSYNHPRKLLCEKSLDVFDAINSRETCGGPRRHLGSLFTISGVATEDTLLQLGLDWGLGGFTKLSLGGELPTIEHHDSDVWWRKDWSNSDVLELFIPAATEFVMVGLGFEGCCDGYNSARWRSLGTPAGIFATYAVGAEAPEWYPVEVSVLAAVPVPGGAYLLGLGLFGLAASRRQVARA